MSTNFSIYNETVARMNVADLSVGDTLVRIIRPENRYGQTVGSFKTVEYTVTKVLKTRLVLKSDEGHELRLVVENSKWSIRNGDVTTNREGDANNYRSTSYDFATADDEIIEKLRRRYEMEAMRDQHERETRDAVNALQARGAINDLEKLQAAIDALQTQMAFVKANKR